MRYLILYLMPLFGLATSCGGEPVTITLPPVTLTDSADIAKYGKLDPEIVPYLLVLDSIYGTTPLYFKDNGHIYFYVVKGEFMQYDIDIIDMGKMGIVSENLEVLVPVEYDKIYSPDGVAKGYIEIEKSGSKKLFNYQNGTITNSFYDQIFPTTKQGIVAIGKRTGYYHNILPDGSDQQITNTTDIPTYNPLQIELNLNAKDPKWRYLMSSYVAYAVTDGDTVYPFGRGVLVPPSYLTEPRFAHQWIEGIGTNSDRTNGTFIASNSTIEVFKPTKWGFNIFVTNFYEAGSNGMGFATHQKRLAIIDTNNNVLNTQMIFTFKGYEDLCEAPDPRYRLVNDSLIEVRTVRTPFGYKVNEDDYDAKTIYQYYSLSEQGGVTLFKSDRVYEFPMFVYITEDYFKGCYLWERKKDKEKKINWPKDNAVNFYVTEHLTADDLEVMQNEIYAWHGLIFKD